MSWTDPTGVTHATLTLSAFYTHILKVQRTAAREVHVRFASWLVEHNIDAKSYEPSENDLTIPEVTPVCDEGNFMLLSETDPEEQTVNCLSCIAATIEKED